MNTSPKFPCIVLTVCAMCMLIPIGGAYLWSFLLLCWLVAARPWRADRIGGLGEPLADALKPVTFGAWALSLSLILANLIAAFSSDYAEPLKKVLGMSSHMFTKLTLLWLVLAAGQRALARRGFVFARDGVFWFLGFLTLHLVYCFVQRQTGIDWTHGFRAQLGQHRFAYGVYRVSGFHGHPLTLSYNLMLLVLAAAWIVWHGRNLLGKTQRLAWGGVLAVALVTLVITGSRFPLVALALTLLVCEGKRLWRYKWWVAGAAAVMLLALGLEGSTFGRVAELFDEKIPITERFSRVVFWQVHWQIFLEHPLAGIGIPGIDRAYAVYYAGIEPSDKMYSAHDIFLQVLADTGLIGFCGLLLALFGIFKAARRLDQIGADGSALRYLAWGAIFSGLLQNTFRDSEFLFAFWFLAAALSVLAAQRAELREHGKSPQNFQPPARPAHSAAHLPG
jgi:O-antigen ligase